MSLAEAVGGDQLANVRLQATLPTIPGNGISVVERPYGEEAKLSGEVGTEAHPPAS